jgi:hypothetical protein
LIFEAKSSLNAIGLHVHNVLSIADRNSNSKFLSPGRLIPAWVPVLVATASLKKQPLLCFASDSYDSALLSEDMLKRCSTTSLLCPVPSPLHIFQIDGVPLSAVQRHPNFYKQLLHMFTKPGKCKH